MNTPADLRYATSHEWVRLEGIEVNEEDFCVVPVDRETQAILDFRLALRDKAGEE